MSTNQKGQIKRSKMLTEPEDIDQFLNLKNSAQCRYESSPEARDQRSYETGRWTPSQQQAYLDILRMNLNKWQMHEALVKAISTRTLAQIRVHHHKMIRKYKTVEGILTHDIRPSPGLDMLKTRLDYINSILGDALSPSDPLSIAYSGS